MPNHTYKKYRTHYRIWAKGLYPVHASETTLFGGFGGVGHEQSELGLFVAEFEDIMVARRYVRRRLARDRVEYAGGRTCPTYTIEVRHPPAPLRPPQVFASAP